MSYELVAILLFGTLGAVGDVLIAVMVYRNERWRDAYDAAILRRVEEMARRLG